MWRCYCLLTKSPCCSLPPGIDLWGCWGSLGVRDKSTVRLMGVPEESKVSSTRSWWTCRLWNLEVRATGWLSSGGQRLNICPDGGCETPGRPSDLVISQTWPDNQPHCHWPGTYFLEQFWWLMCFIYIYYCLCDVGSSCIQELMALYNKWLLTVGQTFLFKIWFLLGIGTLHCRVAAYHRDPIWQGLLYSLEALGLVIGNILLHIY